MAYPSDYVRTPPNRSRSRDDPPMWRNSNEPWPRNCQYRDAWRYVPPVRDTRRVLIIVNLDQVRPVLSEVGHDHMDMTSCSELPGLGCLEEIALFTMSSSIRHMCDLPLWKHCSTTSVSTSITPGIASWNTRPWTFVGKTSPATPSSCGTSTSCSTCFMNTAHAGLRVKNVESCSPTKLARL